MQHQCAKIIRIYVSERKSSKVFWDVDSIRFALVEVLISTLTLTLTLTFCDWDKKEEAAGWAASGSEGSDGREAWNSNL